IRRERKAALETTTEPRATPRELVERLLRPAADNLSQRRSVRGRPTLTEDLARAGLSITPSEYLLIRIGAVALGALIGLFRFCSSSPSAGHWRSCSSPSPTPYVIASRPSAT